MYLNKRIDLYMGFSLHINYIQDYLLNVLDEVQQQQQQQQNLYENM